jgi:hypothetical protein
MWVVCGVIAYKDFREEDKAVPVMGFKLVNLENGSFNQISLSRLVNNKLKDVCMPLNLIDTIERWKRGDGEAKLCVSRDCLLFRKDAKWVGLYIKMPVYNKDGSFYFYDSSFFRLNDIDEGIGVYIDLYNEDIKYIYKGCDIETGLFTGSDYIETDKNRKFGLGNCVELEYRTNITSLWKREGIIEKLGDYICRLDCSNRGAARILRGFTFAEVKGCCNAKLFLPKTLINLSIIGETIPENVTLSIDKDTPNPNIISIVTSFLKRQASDKELKLIQNIDSLFGLCKKYNIRLVLE